MDVADSNGEDVESRNDQGLQQLLEQRTTAIRQLRLHTPYSGGLLADVLIARRVLSLWIDIDRAPAQPLTLRPSARADDLLVTSLRL
jgi:hypothetical protein